jgi:hypothetical protein
MVADYIATPICHIFNLSLEEGVCPQTWREAKSFLYPRVVKMPLLGLTADVSACCQLLANCCKKNGFDQVQYYFSVIKMTIDFQNAYREWHSTCTALTEIMDDWLNEIVNNTIAGAVVFSVAFDIIEHDLLLRKRLFYGLLTAIL